MSMTELKMSFPTEKLDALRFFMGKKEQSIEKELQDYLDKTYEKLVPAQMRAYLESRIESDSPKEQAAAVQQASGQEQSPADQQNSVEQTPSNQQVPDMGTEKALAAKDRTTRSVRRQKEQNAAEPSNAQETPAEENLTDLEEGQGMSMSMSPANRKGGYST